MKNNLRKNEGKRKIIGTTLFSLTFLFTRLVDKVEKLLVERLGMSKPKREEVILLFPKFRLWSSLKILLSFRPEKGAETKNKKKRY